MLRLVRNGAVALATLSAGGWALASYVGGRNELHDLTIIGNGIPTVVQIHDPGCPTCRQLQRELMQAARGFDDGELQVRIADIGTPEGRALATRHDVPHVTLLLFDGHGNLRRVLQGLNDREYLRAQFEAHLSRTAPSPGGPSPPG